MKVFMSVSLIFRELPEMGSKISSKTYHFLPKFWNLPDLNEEFPYIFYTFLINFPEMKGKSPWCPLETYQMHGFLKHISAKTWREYFPVQQNEFQPRTPHIAKPITEPPHGKSWKNILHSCINTYVWHHCQIDQKQCSNDKNHVQIMEFTCCLNMFFCMTLRDKTLRPRMSISSVLILMSTLLAEMMSLTFEFASWCHFVQRASTYKIWLSGIFGAIFDWNQVKCKDNYHAWSLGRHLNTRPYKR